MQATCNTGWMIAIALILFPATLHSYPISLPHVPRIVPPKENLDSSFTVILFIINGGTQTRLSRMLFVEGGCDRWLII